MHLRIVWIFTWISLSSVIAEPKWFIQDDSNVDTEEDLFASEQLILIQSNRKAKPKPELLTKPKKTDRNEDNLKDKGTKETQTPVNVIKKNSHYDFRSENLIPVTSSRRKPLQVKDAVEPKSKLPKESSNVPKQSTNFNVESTDDVEPPCDPEKDIECLMEGEGLMLVAKKVQPKSQQTSQSKDGYVPKHVDIEKSAVHRRLLQTERNESRPRVDPVLIPIEEDEELIFPTEVDESVEETIRRFKRQISTDVAGSGDGSFFEFQDPSGDPVYQLKFQTKLKIKHKGDLSFEKRLEYIDAFQEYLNNTFASVPGFEGVQVTDIRLDKNKRIVADWDLLLRPSGAPGNNQQQRKQNMVNLLTSQVPQINDMVILGNPIHSASKLNPKVVATTATATFEDLCQAPNSCMDDYVCIRRPNQGSICQHKCYSSGLIDNCLNGGNCQINDQFEPYCQCGRGYSGKYCDVGVLSQDVYTLGDKIGAGLGIGLVIFGMCGICIYMMGCWRKKEKDMEYSYFGDDDSAPSAFQDADSRLGINNYYIDRPHVSLTPLDIYSQISAGHV